MLTVLVAILTFNYVDRLALGLLLQDIKTDLGLSDTQLGVLSGIAFALFYSVLGIPIARWADRGNRITIISITTILWSAAVSLCGLAGTFVHLLLIRIGVAVGEAGCIPPAHSLIADYFSRAERPRAVAIYKLGAPLSVLVGYFAAGWLNELIGWRATFAVLGLPGVFLAAIAWFTLREPRIEGGASLKDSSVAPGSVDDRPGFALVCRTLWGIRSFRHLLIGFCIHSFFSWGTQQWQPAYFIRSFGLKTGELGTWLGVLAGCCGVLGMFLGGVLASRLAPSNERVQLRTMAVAYGVTGVLSTFIYIAPNPHIAFLFLGLATIGGAAVLGPLFATIQSLVPDHMRATSVALLYLFANLIGMGLGPLAAGALSDALRALAGEHSLRYSLLILCPGAFWVAFHYWQASKTVLRDLEASAVAK